MIFCFWDLYRTLGILMFVVKLSVWKQNGSTYVCMTGSMNMHWRFFQLLCKLFFNSFGPHKLSEHEKLIQSFGMNSSKLLWFLCIMYCCAYWLRIFLKFPWLSFILLLPPFMYLFFFFLLFPFSYSESYYFS